MRMVELIERKRDGNELSGEEIRFIVTGYVAGSIPDYQVSALTMAIYYSGMNFRETADLTMAMAESGEMLEISLPGRVVVDKHSSGGVGDKTTLIVAPLVAACGVPVAKMSGRGLGHTGGTIDKLQSIPGFKVEMDQEDFISQVNRTGIAVIAQSQNLVPADKKLYALRDVTATVNSIPLIASSIMSKKIASGAGGIVLDVKYGSGAFMPTVSRARELANAMVAIGKNTGRDTVALLSNMDEPLGRAIGNSLEVLEAIDCLQGHGTLDLMEVCMELAGWMLIVGKKTDSVEIARGILEDALSTGKAWNKFVEFVTAQGGDLEALRKKNPAPVRAEYKAPKAGYIQRIDARKTGVSAMVLGAGRETKDSDIDYGAGICLLKKHGDYVRKGEPIMALYTSSEDKLRPAMNMLNEAISINDTPDSAKTSVSKVIR